MRTFKKHMNGLMESVQNCHFPLFAKQIHFLKIYLRFKMQTQISLLLEHKPYMQLCM